MSRQCVAENRASPIHVIISLFCIGVQSTPYLAIKDSIGINAKLGLVGLVLVSPSLIAGKASARDIEGYVAITYMIDGIGGHHSGLDFIEGATDGLDIFDHLYDEVPSPDNAHVKGVGSIEGREARSIALPPITDVVGDSASEGFNGSIVVNEGKSVSLEDAESYLTWSISGLEGCDVYINGVNARENSRLDFSNISGTFGQGEHSTANWNVYVTYVGSGTPDPNDPNDPNEPVDLDSFPDVLRIINCSWQTQYAGSPEHVGLSWELWYRVGASEGIDPYDVTFEYPNKMILAVISVVEDVKLQRDARPKGHQGAILLDLSWVYGPEYPAGHRTIQPNTSNYLKVSMPSVGKFGGGKSLVTLQQVSSDPNVTYPPWDLRRVIEAGAVDKVNNSTNFGQKVGIVSLADMVQKRVVLEEAYALFELRTDKVSIADYNGDKFVDANDYDFWVKDYGKTGPSASDIASKKDDKIILGIPDGRVDQNDLLAFEQEKARCSSAVASSVEGFERPLASDWSVSGDAPWQIASAVAHAGSQCIQAGLVGDNQASELRLTRDCQKGTIRFWRRTSCEQNRDWYRFFINGVQQEQVSGETDWQQVSFPITWAGKKYFLWSYQKDESFSAGADTVWIDDVEIISP
ncbi:MAG: hypothetical protein JW955_14065 [Sedimentisphaerales bacterium]|nr:hypothetical protein [Sedimentisphaerales bacterium]